MTAVGALLLAASVAGWTPKKIPDQSKSMASSSLSVNPNTGDVALAGNVTAPNLAMFRNKIINGNFDVWQRGTSFASVVEGAYTADRWVVFGNGVGVTRAVTRQAFAPGQTDVPNNPAYWLRYSTSVAGTGGTYASVAQKIESVRTLAGTTATLSFYAKASSNISLVFAGQQYFGTGGSPSATAYFNSTVNVTVTNAWQKFTVPFAVPSIAGKTLGTDNNDFLIVVIGLPGNAVWDFDIAQVQLEQGSQATAFDVRAAGIELMLCQRYYVRMIPSQTYSHIPAAGFINTASQAVLTLTLPCQMRGLGAFTYGGSFMVVAPNITGTSTIDLDATSSSTFAVRLNVAVSSGTVGYAALLRFQNNLSSYIAFDAEL